MSKITCDICKDLIPLVQDGVASKDSEEAVKEHIKSCTECNEYASLYKENSVESEVNKGINNLSNPNKEINDEKIFNMFMKKVKSLFIMLAVFGVVFGLGLTAKDNVLYNSIIMPIIGVIGYGICRWKAVYIVPGFMLLCYIATMVMQLIEGIEYIEILGFLMYVGIYIVFVIAGVVITGLLHYALRKE